MIKGAKLVHDNKTIKKQNNTFSTEFWEKIFFKKT